MKLEEVIEKIIKIIDERIEKWKSLYPLYDQHLYHEHETEKIAEEIGRRLHELEHREDDVWHVKKATWNYLLGDYYYDKDCIAHIIKELEIIKKLLKQNKENKP
jgi:hypothetical protein